MSWSRLTIDDLRLILSEKEVEQLNQYSLDESMTEVINSTIDMIADTWRGALSAKGYALDLRDSYIPSSYKYYVLTHARHAVWTRFPNSEQIALDKRRLQEYEKALDLLKNPILDVDPVTPEGQAGDEDAIGTGAGSIRVPWNRIPQWYNTDSRQSLRLDNYF